MTSHLQQDHELRRAVENWLDHTVHDVFAPDVAKDVLLDIVMERFAVWMEMDAAYRSVSSPARKGLEAYLKDAPK
uniref:Uncharacterized protein n=1 Tax=viral metagenome TaxID=1070528 RepID=A0A6M3LEG4_9ZZZZ